MNGARPARALAPGWLPSECAGHSAPDRQTEESAMSFEPSPRGVDLRQRVTEFLESEVIPAEVIYEQQMADAGDPHAHPPVIEDLKAEARERGLWNLFMPHATPWTP